ncbi:dienelactone hydrolase family protein [Gemmobacter nectariphilus]|uniref:dienelactone hydrolase family protein n=1 Tax=Gemmobacter nectariphilus TaxID=220343 RepID=UPI0003FFBB61|nr:dienelactone hydrolase family protein [Gemmobacter nectariphilus]
MTQIVIPAADGGSFGGYLARPATLPAPGLVLIQYICGVNQVMRRLADHFAALGYMVLVPDIYWRQEPDVQLIPDPARPSPEDIQRALSLNAGIRDDLAVSDLIAAAEVLRALPGCDGHVGALGYCLGGRLVVPMAARGRLDAAVSYYGVNLDSYLPEAEASDTPLLVHVAGEDDLVPAPVREALRERLGARKDATVVMHPGVNHAFALPSGPNYDADAAIRANSQSIAFLARHLPVNR